MPVRARRCLRVRGSGLQTRIFTGVVTDVTWSGDKKQQLSHTTIVVERGFRGASGQVVLTGTVLSSCHYNFTVGQRYLVYARRNADGTLSTGSCSGNKLLADAEEDLDYAEHFLSRDLADAFSVASDASSRTCSTGGTRRTNTRQVWRSPSATRAARLLSCERTPRVNSKRSG